MSVLLSRDQKRAVVEKMLWLPEPDSVLVEYAKQLMVPIVVPTRLFGDIILNPVYEWFEARADWRNKIIRLIFHTDERDKLAEMVLTAEALWEDQAGWEQRVQDLAVSELLSLKNEAWLHEGEPEMSPEEFKAKMILEAISLKHDGLFEFWYEDAEVFGDHVIRAAGNLVDGLTEVHLEG